MENLKSGFSNKIIVYQMPLFERIMGIFSMVVLTSIPILGLIIPLYESKKELIVVLVLLIAMILYCFFMYFNIFMTYICLDVKNKKLVIRESPGFKKEELYLDNIIDIKVSDGIDYKELFTIDIHCNGYTKKIISWSTEPRLTLFNTYKRQIKRLKNFTEKCNQVLK